MTQVKRGDEEVLVCGGEGIIKLSNIKIQYHKKMKQYTIFVCFLCVFVFLQVFIIADVVHQVCDS